MSVSAGDKGVIRANLGLNSRILASAEWKEVKGGEMVGEAYCGEDWVWSESVTPKSSTLFINCQQVFSRYQNEYGKKRYGKVFSLQDSFFMSKSRD